MLMTPPPSDTYNSPAINHQTMSPLNIPGLQKQPFLTQPGFQNNLGMGTPQMPGQPGQMPGMQGMQGMPGQGENMNIAHLLSQGG